MRPITRVVSSCWSEVSLVPAIMFARCVCVLLAILLTVPSSSPLSCVPFQANSSWTPCPGMTANKDIHLDQLAGKWYMHQTLVPPAPAGTNDTAVKPGACLVMTLQKTERGFLAAGTTPGEEKPWRNNATLLIQDPVTYPGLWDETIVTEAGTERAISRSQLMQQGSQTLVVAICPPTSAYACNERGTKPMVLVWGRNASANSHDLEAINNKMRQAGISYVDNAVKISPGTCDGLV